MNTKHWWATQEIFFTHVEGLIPCFPVQLRISISHSPGTETGTVRCSVVTVAYALSCGVYLVVQLCPAVTMLGLRRVPSRKTWCSIRALYVNERTCKKTQYFGNCGIYVKLSCGAYISFARALGSYWASMTSSVHKHWFSVLLARNIDLQFWFGVAFNSDGNQLCASATSLILNDSQEHLWKDFCYAGI